MVDSEDTSEENSGTVERELEVLEGERGFRIERLLANRLEELGRRGATLLLGRGCIRIEGCVVRRGYRVAEGQRVTVRLPFTGLAHPAPQLPLNIVYESARVLVVDKPAGLPAVAVPGGQRDTLAGALVARFPELARVGSGRESGLVHRLDNQTSGLSIVARDPSTYLALRAVISSQQMEKRYLAIVSGNPASRGERRSFLRPDPRSRRRVIESGVGMPGARDCLTRYRVIERKERGALVEVSAHAAYRHQIRVQLASAGYPLFGDLLYGGPGEDLAPRHALHASYVSCDHEVVFAAHSQLPEDLRSFWARL